MERAADLAKQVDSARAILESYQRKTAKDRTEVVAAKAEFERLKRQVSVDRETAELHCKRLVPIEAAYQRAEQEKRYVKAKEAMAGYREAKLTQLKAQKER